MKLGMNRISILVLSMIKELQTLLLHQGGGNKSSEMGYPITSSHSINPEDCNWNLPCYENFISHILTPLLC